MSQFDFVGSRKAITASGLSANEKLLTFVLIEHMPDCFPGKSMLANETGLSKATVDRSIHSLERLGVLLVDRSKASTGKAPNIYCFAPNWKAKLPARWCHPDTRISETPVSDRGGITATPEGVSQGVVGGITQTPKAGSKQETKQEDPAPPSATLAPDASFARMPAEPERTRPAKTPNRMTSTRSGNDGAAASDGAQTKPDKPKHPGFKRVVDTYFEAFNAKCMHKPVFTKADGKWVNTLLEAVNNDTEEACRIVRNAFTDGRWFSGVTMKTIGSDPSKFISGGPSGQTSRAQSRSRSGPIQPGINDRIRYGEDDPPGTARTGSDQ